ncbi:MAG TPA: hypothetical protein VN607_04690 [Gemmatimonadaceae bacterium]|nr:hypothetical protein [Gemmatimonadaceae bacterium]
MSQVTRRYKIWMTVGAAFASLNFLGATVAAAQGEALHAGTHAGLTLVTLLVMWWFMAAVRERRDATAGPALRAEVGDRLSHLEQSVDAMAIEIERIGEGQRFLTQHLTRGEPSRPPRD